MTIISAMNPYRFDGSFIVALTVWFEELAEPVLFRASPLDVEVHGRELWIRAMAGEYGEVKIVKPPTPSLTEGEHHQ